MIMPGMNRGIASIAGFLVDSDDDSGAIPKMTIPPAMIKIAEIIKWVTGLVNEETLYVGVFLASLIETVFPPIPTLAVFPLAGFVAAQSGMGLLETILLGVIGGIGASIGSTIIYVVS